MVNRKATHVSHTKYNYIVITKYVLVLLDYKKKDGIISHVQLLVGILNLLNQNDIFQKVFFGSVASGGYCKFIFWIFFFFFVFVKSLNFLLNSIEIRSFAALVRVIVFRTHHHLNYRHHTDQLYPKKEHHHHHIERNPKHHQQPKIWKL